MQPATRLPQPEAQPDGPAPDTATTEDALLRIVVVDDHAVVRAGLRHELGAAGQVVGEADSCAAAVEVIVETQPDVVVVDVHLPDGRADTILTRCRDAGSDARFLALSASDDAEDVVAVIRAGARGYLTKDAAADVLISAVVQVAAGDAAFSPQLAGFVLDAFAALPAALDTDLAGLTPREREVLRLLARGYTYREAAESLVLSPRTIETHASNVLRKLQLANRGELRQWAENHNLA